MPPEDTTAWITFPESHPSTSDDSSPLLQKLLPGKRIELRACLDMRNLPRFQPSSHPCTHCEETRARALEMLAQARRVEEEAINRLCQAEETAALIERLHGEKARMHDQQTQELIAVVRTLEATMQSMRGTTEALQRNSDTACKTIESTSAELQRTLQRFSSIWRKITVSVASKIATPIAKFLLPLLLGWILCYLQQCGLLDRLPMLSHAVPQKDGGKKK